MNKVVRYKVITVLFMLCFMAVVSIHTEVAGAEPGVIQLSTNELSLYPGDTYSFISNIFVGGQETTVEYYLVNASTGKRIRSSKYLNLDPVTGIVVALKPGSVILTAEIKVWDNLSNQWQVHTDQCKITIFENEITSGINYTSLTKAVGSKPVRLKVTDLEEDETVKWKSDNKEVAKVGKKGKITPIGVGTTRITGKVKRNGKKVRSYECDVEVTQPMLASQTVVTEKGNTNTVQIEGLSEKSTVVYAVEKPEIAVISFDGTVYAKAEGSTEVKINIDGCEFPFVVYVTDAASGTKVIRMVKDDTKTIIPEGIADGTVVTYQSAQPKIASVDENGTITGGKAGNTVITVTYGEITEKYHVSVGENRKALQAVEEGEKLIGCAYDTGRRMEEGYYDCSSYVFRVFAPLGYLFGCESATQNAPSSAALAEWCSEQNCVLATEPVYDLDMLLPGDLIFYSYGGNNDRFLNIDHVAIYSGYGTIIHASDEKTGVRRSNYWVDKYIVMVARPAA